MIKQKQINKVIQWGTVGAMAYFIGSAIAGAIKRKREQSTSGIGAVTSTGNEKTTIREAWKHRKDNFGYVIFKDIAEPKENQVWVIDGYDPSYREYDLYNYADTSKEKFVKGDKVCYTGFYF